MELKNHKFYIDGKELLVNRGWSRLWNRKMAVKLCLFVLFSLIALSSFVQAAPTWSNNITNDTDIKINDTVIFNVTWAGNATTNLSSWVFNSNISGVEINTTANTTWGLNNASSYSIKINVTKGKHFFYRFYANTSNLSDLGWNETDKFVFTVNNT